MRHRKVSRRLGADSEHHRALMRNLVTDLFKHGRITTTIAKAKELRRVADKMITLAKRGDLASRRRALGFIRDKEVVRKLFSEIREKYLDRAGGYTRVIRIGPRRGDGSMIAVVELVEEKITTKRSRIKRDRLKKVLEFIERKKKEYGLIKEDLEGKQVKAEEKVSQQETVSSEATSSETTSETTSEAISEATSEEEKKSE